MFLSAIPRWLAMCTVALFLGNVRALVFGVDVGQL